MKVTKQNIIQNVSIRTNYGRFQQLKLMQLNYSLIYIDQYKKKI